MRGKTVVITGGTSGIGEVAAVALARMGARIVLVARDKARGDATVARLRDSPPGIAHAIHFADLSRLEEMKRVAAQIENHEPRIDILINNAGAMFATRQLTEDGLERTFALNHLAYFVITQGLRERLLASGRPARIINTASARTGALVWILTISIGQELRGDESLWPVEAVQHPIYARTCWPPERHGGHCEFPTSRVRRHTLWRPKGCLDVAHRLACEIFRDISC